MVYVNMGRRQGKTYMLLCERASELELQITFAKRFNLPYKKEEQELNQIYKKLDGGKYVEEKPKKTVKQASTKKYKN